MIEPLESRNLFAAIGLDPSHGDSGTFRVTLHAGNSVKAVAFAADGSGYALVNVATGPKGAAYSLYKVTNAGTLDTTFANKGVLTVESKTGKPPTALSVSPAGRVTVSEGDFKERVFNARGVEQQGIEKRIVAAFRQAGVVARTDSSGGLVRSLSDNAFAGLSSDAMAYDDSGRTLVLGTFKKTASDGGYVGVMRFNTDGTLDQTFGRRGVAATSLNASALNDADTTLYGVQPRIAVGRTGYVAVLVNTNVGTKTNDADEYASVDYALLRSRGTQVRSGHLAADEENPEAETDPALAEANSFDLRPLADGSFAALTQSGGESTNQRSILTVDGTYTQARVPGFLGYAARLTPSGATRSFVTDKSGTVGGTQPPEGRSDVFYPADGAFEGAEQGYFVQGDGRLLVANVQGREYNGLVESNVNTLVIQRFDGTGRAQEGASGSARTVARTRTLDVRGTTGNDDIALSYKKGVVTVVINGKTQTFKSSTFDTIQINAGSGDDTVSTRLTTLDRAVLIRGGSGNDRLDTDAWHATVDGGGGRDKSVVAGDDAVTEVAVETVRRV